MYSIWSTLTFADQWRKFYSEAPKYSLLLIDDYSKKVFVYFLQNKSQAFKVLKEFKALSENQQNRKIKIIRGGDRKEYDNTKIKKFLAENGTSF